MKRILTICLLMATVLTLAAQPADEPRRIYNEAESNYIIGRLDEAKAQLQEHLSLFTGDLRQGAIRLLALCALGLDADDDAQRYVVQLLDDNPYYSTTSEDPQRFIDMVNRLKSGRNATITTASSQTESIEESPVPVTLITEDMIRISGARNLKEVLTAYVPGMMCVDCNTDIDIAMRGIYGQGQEKMLILLNGHRLNSYTTNTASPDFSISLEKVKQIEVLRGPASSLYGGVALSAVVNVITKQGIDIDGVKVRVGGGSYGQVRGDILFGKRYFDLDILVWGSLYRADGQKFFVPVEQTGLKKTEGDVWMGRVGSSPTYDLGITLRWSGLSFLYNTRFSQMHVPFTASYTYSPYDAGHYATFRGLKPSFATQAHHTELSYSKKWQRAFLSATVTYDSNDLTRYQVISDSAVQGISRVLGVNGIFDTFIGDEGGIFRYHDAQETTIGVQVKGDYTSMDSDRHKGLLSFGAHYSRFELTDSRYVLGNEFEYPMLEYSTFRNIAQALGGGDGSEFTDMAKGTEHNADAYEQLKHRWGPFILNGGLRYDYKKRFDNDVQHEFSPRMALIFMQPKWHATLSYSKSFVDAPYLYRKTNLLFYKINMMLYEVERMSNPDAVKPVFNELHSEKLYSWQLTVGTNGLLPGLDVELNGFYNRASDLIYPNQLLHANSGRGENVGLELTAAYTNGPLSAHLSTEWLHVVNAEYFGYDVDMIPGIPDFTANGVLAYRFGQHLRLHTHVQFSGRYKGYVVNLQQGNYSFETYDPYLLVDLGAEYRIGRYQLSLNISNLFDKNYTLTGMSSGPIRQQGRWLMADISIDL